MSVSSPLGQRRQSPDETLERFTPRGRRIWTVVALAALVVSLAGPLAGVDGAVIAALAAMHLAVGAVLIPALSRS